MKKVLILAYDFPPYVSVGALRPYNWYKYFKEFNIEPVVITRQWENKHGNHLDYISESEHPKTITIETEYGTELRTAYKPNFSNRLLLKCGPKKLKLVRKVYSGSLEILQFFMPIGPKKNIYFGAKNYLQNNQVDLIISSGDPFILFKYASKLSREFDIPWIADYRDPWTLGLNSEKKIISKLIFRYFEKKIVKTAAVITTVDQYFKTKLNQYFPDKLILVFPNGYDPENIELTLKIEQQDQKLRIAFVGTIYQWHPYIGFIDTFFNYLSHNQNSKIMLCFYGCNLNEELEDYVINSNVEMLNRFEFHNRMNNKELVHQLALDNVMLLFNYYGFTGTKIYDYIGLKRKILFCFTEDKNAQKLKDKYYYAYNGIKESTSPQIEIINKTNGGILVKDQNHLFQVFQDLETEFEKNGSIACNSINTEDYSRKIQVKKLAEIIHEIVDNKKK